MSQIVYQFRAVGAEAVQTAFKSIGDSAEQSARATQRAQRQGAKGAQSTARAQETAARSASRAQIAEAEKAASAEVKAKKRALDHVAKIRERYFVQAQRDAEKLERAETKAAQRRMQMEDRARSKQRKEKWGTLKSDARGAASGLALSAGAAWTATMGAATMDSIKLKEKANRIAINSRSAGGTYDDPAKLQKEFEATAAATPGIKAIDVADAVSKYISLTGDKDTAMKAQGTFATVASATGTDIGDVAEAAASLGAQFDVTGLEEMRDVLAALAYQGKAGSFELSDAAAQFQKLAAAGAAFGLDKGAGGAKTLGGLTQIARSGTGSADEAATSVSAMFSAFQSKQKELKAAGVSVYKKGKVRSIEDLLVDSISKVGGNDAGKKAAGLNTIFGEQGSRAINPLVNTYNDARNNTVGTEAEKTAAGVAALRAELDKAINAPGTWADIVSDSAQAQQDSSAKLTAAWEKTSAMAGEKLAPALENLVSKLTESGAIDELITNSSILAGAFAELIDVLASVGIVSKKEETFAEREKKATKELEKFDRENNLNKVWADAEALEEGPARDEAMRKAEALEAQRGTLAGNVQKAKDAQWMDGKEFATPLSGEEYRKQMAEGGGNGVIDQMRAYGLIGETNLGAAGWLANRADPMTAEQMGLEQRYESQRAGQDYGRHPLAPREEGEGGGGTSPVDDAAKSTAATLAELVSAAGAAAEVLRSIKPPPDGGGGGGSVFGPPIGGRR